MRLSNSWHGPCCQTTRSPCCSPCALLAPRLQMSGANTEDDFDWSFDALFHEDPYADGEVPSNEMIVIEVAGTPIDLKSSSADALLGMGASVVECPIDH